MVGLDDIFDMIIGTSRIAGSKGWTVTDATMKLGEEVGELNSAVLIATGRMPHKTLPEPVEGEVADVIICALDTLQKVHPDWSNDFLVAKLLEQLSKKRAKWDGIVKAMPTRFTQDPLSQALNEGDGVYRP